MHGFRSESSPFAVESVARLNGVSSQILGAMVASGDFSDTQNSHWGTEATAPGKGTMTETQNGLFILKLRVKQSTHCIKTRQLQ